MAREKQEAKAALTFVFRLRMEANAKSNAADVVALRVILYAFLLDSFNTADSFNTTDSRSPTDAKVWHGTWCLLEKVHALPIGRM